MNPISRNHEAQKYNFSLTKSSFLKVGKKMIFYENR